jgi:single-stranded-DNA-specific exonuclease
MDLASQRIVTALREGEKILIYGDYDVDGTTSVALMTLFFRDCGFEVPYYIPDRYTEGYGISYQGIDYAVKNGINLVIALDCGTKAIDKLKYAAEQGVDFIVVDHHTPGAEDPAAVALINPRHKDCKYPFKELPACGLGFKLVQALAETIKKELPESKLAPDYDAFARFSDLVCLAVACDIVPLVGENRILAYHGLRKFRKNPLSGLKALMDLAEMERDWNVSDLVFFLGPRINSAGRLGSARDAVRLLLGEGDDLPEFAAALHTSNHDRKALDSAITNEALAVIEQTPGELDRSSTVLFHADWHKGVIGIVASRLIERHYRPTILLTSSGDNLVGSGRSVSGFDLYAALESCTDHLVQFGGHKYAAGLTLKKENYEAFREQFEKEVASTILPDQLVPKQKIASLLEFPEINARLIRLIGRFSPFGPGNPEPVFEARDVEVLDARILKVDHVKFSLRQHGVTFEAIGFSMAHLWSKINELKLDIAYQPALKSYRGRTSIQLKMKDFKASSARK